MWLVAWCVLATLPAVEAPAASRYTRVTVVDEQTGRGVPLVQLRTVDEVSYWTDSQGIAAVYEPELVGREVFFHVSSHGYEYPPDGFGIRGAKIRLEPGGQAHLKLRRINLAERLYRLSGAGIYRDSRLVGAAVPPSDRSLPGDVVGLDSVVNAAYRGKLYWFWGDTNRPGYPLGNYQATGATSPLPSDSSVRPDVGVELTYFTGENGIVKPMAPMPGPGPTWLSGPIVLRDDRGQERLLAPYVKIKPPLTVYARGLAIFDDERQVFQPHVRFEENAPNYPSGHPLYDDAGGEPYVYFATPYPLLRVRASLAAVAKLDQYEAYSCWSEDTPQEARLDRDEQGRVRYAWRPATPALDPPRQARALQAGTLKPHEGLLMLRDRESGKEVTAHSGSVAWNAYRKRWVMITVQHFGSSLLGEIWLAEAETLIGPWAYAVKVVTHDRYSFYNPRHHPWFDADEGRRIFFEGTYTATFSGNPAATPRYDYNQIMYRLDLETPEAHLPVAVYRTRSAADGEAFSLGAGGASFDPAAIPFFALDRPAPGVIPLYAALDDQGRVRLVRQAAGTPLCYVYPPDAARRPQGTQPLFASGKTEDTDYTVGDRREGETRPAELLGYVWPNPWRGEGPPPSLE